MESQIPQIPQIIKYKLTKTVIIYNNITLKTLTPSLYWLLYKTLRHNLLYHRVLRTTLLWCDHYLYTEYLFQTVLSFLRSEDLSPQTNHIGISYIYKNKYISEQNEMRQQYFL